jgi:hypothetical protein
MKDAADATWSAIDPTRMWGTIVNGRVLHLDGPDHDISEVATCSICQDFDFERGRT